MKTLEEINEMEGIDRAIALREYHKFLKMSRARDRKETMKELNKVYRKKYYLKRKGINSR